TSRGRLRGLEAKIEEREVSCHRRTTARSSRISSRLFSAYLKRYQSVTNTPSGPPSPRRAATAFTQLRSCSSSSPPALGGGRGWVRWVRICLSAHRLRNAGHLTLPSLARWAPPSPPQSAAEREFEQCVEMYESDRRRGDGEGLEDEWRCVSSTPSSDRLPQPITL